MYTLGGVLADTAARPKKRYANAERRSILRRRELRMIAESVMQKWKKK
jgi:hypothetical protein